MTSIITRTLLVAGAVCGLPYDAAAAQAESIVARQVDLLLEGEMDSPAQPASVVDDATFLRRASLDLVGEPPLPQQLTLFLLDRSTDKRTRLVDRLLESPYFGQNWARYWRDVILARRTDERALAKVGNSLTVFLTAQFNRGAGWDDIARAFVTATGDVQQHGETAVIFAQEGKAAETAAEISRLFLGIQIQCAQCHDHPYDQWKRKQFHQLAAFFPRVAVRPKRNSAVKTFEVVSRNRDAPQRRKNRSIEHYMPDLDNPSARGTLMAPIFFVTSQNLLIGSTDQKRRRELAQWMTDPKNAWFARSLVNRMWSELVGTGFYEPVDDIGPQRECAAPKTLDYLAGQFVEADYSVKWLFRVIMATEAYQRTSRSRDHDSGQRFAANRPQLLRADQLMNTLIAALGSDESEGGSGRKSRKKLPRNQFNTTFGYDPSILRTDVKQSIPQALLLMNSPRLNRDIDGRRRRTALGQLLAKEKDNEMVVNELYLLCLARESTKDELAICLKHVRSAKNRAEGFEDVLWALVNSAEMRYRK